MTGQTHGHSGSPSTTSSNASGELLDLDALGAMSIGALNRCYGGGRVPDSLRTLDGAHRGRMLTIVGPIGRGVLRRAIQRIAASRSFPWRGKSFRSIDDESGGGINRVALLGGRFPFDTRFGPSAIDGEPCIVLDYDKPANPFFVRAIRDELREIGPGLFLGPAMIKLGASAELALYFAICTV